MKTIAEKRRSPAVWIGTVAGVGSFPLVPGTAGSAVGVGLVAALGAIPWARPWGAALLGLTTGAVFVLGVWSAGWCEKYFGRVDPGQVVIDEVAGQMVVFLLRPHASWKLLFAGFVLFRFFDMTKPFPAGRAERLPAGWGIMVDDLLAGVYALIILTLLSHVVR